MTWIAVAAGGALGSVARHLVNLEIARWKQTGPYATLVVNVIGCLVIGVLAGRIAGGRLQLTRRLRTFVFVGILGGFTTFSHLRTRHVHARPLGQLHGGVGECHRTRGTWNRRGVARVLHGVVIRRTPLRHTTTPFCAPTSG